MGITVKNFVDEFVSKKIQNTKIDEHAIEKYIKKTLEVKEYIPFREKRRIAENVVEQNTELIDGVWKNDSMDQYVTFVLAMLETHTNLQIDSEDPVLDYDIIAESGLLPLVISTFQNDYNECDVVLKAVLAMKLEDNNVNVLVGKFLNGILTRLDSVGEVLQDKFGGMNIKDILGVNFTEKDIAALSRLLDKLK